VVIQQKPTIIEGSLIVILFLLQEKVFAKGKNGSQTFAPN
jgi:hypothetical protein